jgi:hypothetical protein
MKKQSGKSRISKSRKVKKWIGKNHDMIIVGILSGLSKELVISLLEYLKQLIALCIIHR